MTSKAEQKRTEKNEAITELKKLCPPGKVVYCILRSVSRTGMSRTISFKVINKDALREKDREVLQLDGLIAKALGMRLAKHDGLIVNGCGMDMGFHVVSSLSEALHGGSYDVSHRWL